MFRRPQHPSSSVSVRFAACLIVAAVAMAATSLSQAGVQASAATRKKTTTTKATKKTTTTKKRATVTTRSRAVLPTLPRTTTTTAPLPTLAPVPSSTQAPLPTTAATTTTVAAPAFDFDILIPTPSQTVPAGSTASFVVIIATKPPSLPQAVTFIATGMPEGSNATLSPNPTTSGAEFRVNIGPNVPVGIYTVRLTGSSNNVIRTVNVTVNVTAAAATSTTSTTTTTIGSGPTSSTIVVGAGSPTFAVIVSSDGSKLRSGGTVAYNVRIIPAAGFTTPAALQFSGLPSGVSGTFTPLTQEGTSTLYVSSTVAIIPGTYTFNLIAVAGAYQQLVPVRLIIE
jgi:hypothetical protein